MNGGVLAQDSYVCDQLIAAKNFAVWAGEHSPAEVFAAYPVTYFHAAPWRTRNSVVYGATVFSNGGLDPPVF
jgi:hypothetical protein